MSRPGEARLWHWSQLLVALLVAGMCLGACDFCVADSSGNAHSLHQRLPTTGADRWAIAYCEDSAL
jgi:hypothetical protein